MWQVCCSIGRNVMVRKREMELSLQHLRLFFTYPNSSLFMLALLSVSSNCEKLKTNPINVQLAKLHTA